LSYLTTGLERASLLGLARTSNAFEDAPGDSDRLPEIGDRLNFIAKPQMRFVAPLQHTGQLDLLFSNSVRSC